MKTKNKVTVSLFCFLLAALSVGAAFVAVVSLFIPPAFSQAPAKDGELHWTQTLAQKNSPYPVLDSGVWADALHNSFIYWLDNNRVLFKNSEETEKARYYRGRFNLAIWDTRTNKVTPYGEYAKSLSVCYREGFIYYTLEDEKKNQLRFAGELGKEKPFAPPNEKNVRYNEMDCQFHADPAPAEKLEGPKRHDLKFLLYRHGYLDYGPRTENRNLPLGKGKPILLYHKVQNEPIVIPITNEGAKLRQYYEFKDAYFIHELVGGGGRWYGDSVIAWWLFPDGKVTEVKIPNGPYKQGGSVGFYPTRKGIFVRYDTFRSNKDPGEAGGYLVTGKNATRVIVGHLKEPAVSTDGCKVAFVHQPYSDADLPNDSGRVTLKMINFCTEEKQP